jgi:hypothetical protein
MDQLKELQRLALVNKITTGVRSASFTAILRSKSLDHLRSALTCNVRGVARGVCSLYVNARLYLRRVGEPSWNIREDSCGIYYRAVEGQVIR